MSKKDNIFFTDEDIERAKSISILDVAQRLGFHLVKQGSIYSTKEHDSLKIYPISNTYYRFATGESGNTINFVRNFSNLDFKEAMKFLLGEIERSTSSKNFSQIDQKEKITEEKENFHLPKLNNNIKRSYSYLVNTRKISKEVVNEFIKNKSIREDINHNVLFIGFDEKQNPKYCTLSGTLSEVKYKGEVKNSDKRYGFRFENKYSKKVLVFESPIDLLSAKTILKSKGKDRDYSYLSLGGLSPLALENFLENNKNVDTIVFMLDNDIKGRETFENMNEKYKDKYKIMDMSFQYEGYKDVNALLQSNDLKDIHFKSFKDEKDIEKQLISDNFFDLKEYRNEIEKEILYDENKFIDFLKVMGNNHKQSYNNQLFISVMYPTATACTTKENWEKFFNRNIKDNAKEIEVLKGNSFEIIYDIKDTKLIDGEEDTFYHWGEIKERNFLNINRYLKNNFLTLKNNQSIDDKFRLIVNDYMNKNFKFLKGDIEKEKFLYEALKISSLSKLKQSYGINKKLIKSGLKKFSYKEKLDLMNIIHYFNKEFLGKIKLSEIEKNRKKVLTNEKSGGIIKEKEIDKNIGGKNHATQSDGRGLRGHRNWSEKDDKLLHEERRRGSSGVFHFGEDKGGAEMPRTNSIKQECSNVQNTISPTPHEQKEVRHDSGYVLRWDADETLDRDGGKDRRVLQSPNGMGREKLGERTNSEKNRGNGKKRGNVRGLLEESEIHRNSSSRERSDGNVRLRLDDIGEKEDDNFRNSLQDSKEINVDHSNLNNKFNLQNDDWNGKENKRNDDRLEVEKSTSFNLEENLTQKSLFDNFEIENNFGQVDQKENLVTIAASLPKMEDNTKIYNFKITKEIQVEKLTPSERLNNNIEAISMLNRVESGQRELDSTAQEVLAKYVGWGGLSEVFDESREGQWEVARNFLKENLSTTEYEAAKESTLTAFYTPKAVIDSIYSILDNLGFEKGNILEPSMGIGNFIGNIPDKMNKSKFYGVELDSVSGRIAKLLYPKSNIQVKGFEKTSFSSNFFDVAIGNVPFGDFKINDKEYNKNNFLIHDYFFAKSIDKVRNGGIIAFITSSGTMDKKDESIRKYINARAEFLGAIRLPNSTFKGVAGTEVTSDIIFLKKKEGIREIESDWLHLSKDEKGFTYNKYFVDNPNMVIGSMEEVSGRFGNTLTCVLKENESLKELLNIASLNIKGKIDEVEIEFEDPNMSVVPAFDNVKNFSYTLMDGKIFYRENSVMTECNFKEKDRKKLIDYMKLADKVKEIIDLQKGNFTEEEISESRKELNLIYDEFFKNYDFLNHKLNRKLLNIDSRYPLVSSIEILKNDDFEKKADIFFKRTISKAEIPDKVENSKDALILSINEKTCVDFDFMQKLTDKSRLELIEELRGDIFLNIDEYIDGYKNFFDDFEYISKDEYLSGNIREKLKVLNLYIENVEKKSLEKGTDFEKELKMLNFQKQELLDVMPKDLTASDINVRLGTTWIPLENYKDFIFETLKTSYWAKNNIKISYSPFSSEYHIDGKNYDSYNDLANLTFGTNRVNAYKLIENSLNLKDTKVFDKVKDVGGNEREVLNQKETLLAMQKQSLLNEEFKNWIFKDTTRRLKLEKIYNEKFNSTVNREYDGEKLNFSGINPEIKLKPHQKNAIARTLFGGNTLLAHVVGAGKTFEMVASSMESKRLGLCTKSLFVVPNHLTEQMGREFMALYPGANILVATKKDFEPKNRKRFVGKIATGEYDAVIIGHSQFEKIPMSKEYQEEHIREQISEIVDYIEEYKFNNDQKFTVKDLQKTKKKLEARLEKLIDDDRKDDVICFEELGVDKLFVDEAHSFKNLYLYTKMKNVAGISQTEAIKSSDMFMKCRYMGGVTNNKGVVFATGTPISNSMTELYTMQRYLQYDELKKRDLQNFDAWASTFGETQTALELSPEGTGYRMKTRFSKFHGLPELMNMFKDVADIKTADMLDLDVPKVKFETVISKPTIEQKEVLKTLSERAENVRANNVDPSEDNMLKITNDGKKLALDQRLINEFLPDDENSKVNICVKNVFSIWEKTKEKSLSQIIFCDMSTPKGEGYFNIYDDIKNKLIKKGVPKDEIAFIHDAKNEKHREEIFSKVREGKIRVFIGSTSKCGAGTNIQDKLIALHDLDVPWRPSDLEQRGGRIVRQGNSNKEVEIYRYVTENTFDSYLWQTIENKQRFISQIMTSKTPIRSFEDVDEVTLNYSEIKALATGNPLIKEKMDLDNEIARLKILKSNFNSIKFSLEEKILKTYPKKIQSCEESILAIKKDISSLGAKAKTEEDFCIILKGEKITDKKEAGEKLLEEIKNVRFGEEKVIGEYRNFNLKILYNSFDNTHDFYLTNELSHIGRFGKDAIGNITRMDNVLDSLENKLESYNQTLLDNKEKLEIAKIEVGKPFEKEAELKEKTLRLSELNLLLSFDEKEENLEINNLKDSILKTYNKINSSDETDFNEVFSDDKNVELSYIVDGKCVKYSYDLKDFKSKIYIDNEFVKEIEYSFNENDISKSTPEEQMKNDILMIDKDNGKSYGVEKFLEKSENIVISKEIEKGLCF